MGLSCTQRTSEPAFELRTQADWQNYIQVIRRNTPAAWRGHSEFELAANECLAEAIRSYDPSKGVPFEGFLAGVAKRRVPEVLRRFTAKEAATPMDPQLVKDILDTRADEHDAIGQADSMDVVTRFARTLPPADAEVVLLLAQGLTPAEVARYRQVGRSAVSNAITRIRPRAEALRAAA
jgi:DNA-directed RNA polymerase specialized sigma24 family protein